MAPESLKQICTDCDIFVCDFLEDLETSTSIIQELKTNTDLISEKVIIGLSTVLTWAKTEIEDPEQSLTEEDFRKRRTHPNYKKHLALEKLLLKKGNAMVKGYVVAGGLMFGEGEYYLHSFFKEAWHGQTLPIVGDGSNLIPTIHVRDLAGIVANIISSRPDENYLVGVASGTNTLEEIVKAISTSIGCGDVKGISPEEAIQSCPCDIPSQQMVLLDYLGLNLKVESVITSEMIAWKCEKGLVENINVVGEEFKQKRKLFPLKLFVQGPPASGKTSVSMALAKYYNLPHVQVRELSDDGGKEWGLLNDEKKVEALKRKISNWWGARNQGFVVDGFPETFNQVQLLYPKENTDVPLPDFIISLEASDQFLKERLLSTPQKNMNPLYTETGFAQALSFYRQNTTEEKSPLNFFVQYDEVVPVTVQASQKLDSLVEEVQKSVGKPRNYGPSAEELEAERMRNEKSAKEKAEKIQKEEADKRNSDLELRKKQEEEWKARTTKLQQEEQQILDLQSGPFRTYLMTNIMPLLTKGLIDVVRTRPNDPIDYLAEYLFKHADDQSQ